jgi:hypothetical protein
MSQAVVALLAALVGAAAAIAGQSLVPILTARKAHQIWLRDKRADLCEQFLAELEKAQQDLSGNAQGRKSYGSVRINEHRDHLNDILVRVRIYGSIELTEALAALVEEFVVWAYVVMDSPESIHRGIFKDFADKKLQAHKAIRKELDA